MLDFTDYRLIYNNNKNGRWKSRSRDRRIKITRKLCYQIKKHHYFNPL